MESLNTTALLLIRFQSQQLLPAGILFLCVWVWIHVILTPESKPIHDALNGDLPAPGALQQMAAARNLDQLDGLALYLQALEY